jgi:branched-chain amino acid transport system substrate-binding protein
MFGKMKVPVLCALCFIILSGVGFSQGHDVGLPDGGVRIGVLGHVSDPTSWWGRSFLEGLQTSLNHANSAGGIHGRRIELIPHDLGVAPDTAVAAARHMLAEEEVFAMVLHSDMGVTQAILGRGIGGGPIPVLVSGSLSRSMVSPFSKKAFFFGMSYDDQVALLLEYVLKTNPGRAPEMALLIEDSLLGEAVREGFHRVCAHYGLDPVREDVYSPDTQDLPFCVRQLSLSGARYVVLGSTTWDAAEIIQEATRIGWRPQFLGFSVTVEPDMWGQAGDGAQNYLAVDYLARPWERRPGVSLMMGLTHKWYPGKDAQVLHRCHVLGYVSGLLVAEALRTAGRELTRESFVHGLAHIQDFNTHGLVGPLGFAPDSGLSHSAGRVLRFDRTWQRFHPVTDWSYPMMKSSK